MHHLRVAPTIGPVEQMEYILLEFLAIFINVLAGLRRFTRLHDTHRRKLVAYLLSTWKVNFFGNCIEASKEYSYLAAAFFPLLLQAI